MYSADLQERTAKLQAAQARAFTWHNLGQVVAKAMLLLAWALWIKAYLIFIGPADLLDWALVAGFAFASATIPPICISSLVPSTPANMLLTRLQVRYGWPGFVFASFAALLMTYYSFDVLVAYWSSRPMVAGGGGWEVTKYAILSTLLLVGFPAWALNKMTPDQWIDAVMQAREVARIQRILELEDAAAKAMLARATALLHADVTRMTIEQRATNNAEVVAILAASERGMAQALRQVGLSFKSLYGMELATQVEPDEEITSRHRRVAKLLTSTSERLDRLAGDAETWIVPDPSTTSLVPLPDAERGGSLVDYEATTRGSERLLEPPIVDYELLEKARSALPPIWMRRQLEAVASVSKPTANKLIAEWIAAGLVTIIDDPKHHYSFTESEV